jgi:hypothetical protein
MPQLRAGNEIENGSSLRDLAEMQYRARKNFNGVAIRRHKSAKSNSVAVVLPINA